MGALRVCALRNYLVDDDGTSAIEYGLIASLVSMACVAGLQLIGVSLVGLFESIGDVFATVMAATGGGG